jgi:hypothetical protein
MARLKAVNNARVPAADGCEISANITSVSDSYHPCPQLLDRRPATAGGGVPVLPHRAPPPTAACHAMASFVLAGDELGVVDVEKLDDR